MLMQHFRCLASLAKTTLSDLGKAYDVTPEGFGDALSLTIPETIGTVVRPVTMRYPLRHRPLWDGGEDWEIPTGAVGVLLWSPSVPTHRVPLPFAIWSRGRSFDWKVTQL